MTEAIKKEEEHKSWIKTLRDPHFTQSLKRLVAVIFKHYPVMAPVALICGLLNTIINVTPAVFMQKALSIIGETWQSGDWNAAVGPITELSIIFGSLLAISIVLRIIYGQLIAIITQGTLRNLRNEMFARMEKLPVRYFDTNTFGDIMSHYTNDVDALRMMISNSLTGVIYSVIAFAGITFIMLYYSVWMTLLIVLGAFLMFMAMGFLGANASKFFKAQQENIGVVEGFAEETITGQRTIKVFTHEDAIKAEFDKKNEQLYGSSRTAERYINLMAPILFNVGNILYVIVAVIGSIMVQHQVPNLSLSGMALSLATLIPFLNMTKSFTGQLSNLSDSINPLILGVAGARRIFELIDEKPETDKGYVELVDVTSENKALCNVKDDSEKWAWKHPHQDGTLTYEPLKGDVILEHVDFGYTEKQLVLKDISIHAKPGQKIAFVGATGAGKTTITNLINRFYNINNGTIRYDGINIEKIKKPDLRHSLGVVLQDTHLFSDSVIENIRFGRLNASDEECVAAAILAGADSFITRLPNGYNTQLEDGGTNLSQGQRQLISIARAAVADPPVMILDEATSSIDTRTEELVQMGMDNLMDGRTTFVIAHRLSTVRNADLICVLDHGKIIERGSHKELIEKKGTYYQLYTGAFELE